MTDIRTPVSTIYGDLTEKYAARWARQIELLKAEFGSSVSEVKMPGVCAVEVPVVYVAHERIVSVLRFLKDHKEMNYRFLSDITATDETPREPRFDVVYQLLSHETFARIRIKVSVSENVPVPSLVEVWPGANWAEREVFDMFGISFSGHPNLRRILMDERWVGHPLRKDYPLRGYQIFTDAAPVHPELLENNS